MTVGAPRRSLAPCRVTRVVLTCAGVVSVACAQLLGVDDYRVGPGSPPQSDGGELYTTAAGGFQFESPTCGKCVEANCSDEARACAEEPVCRAWLSCDARCEREDDHGRVTSDEECLADCSQGVLGASESYAVADVVSCRARSCLANCALSPAGLFSRGATCDACRNRACSDAIAERWMDSDTGRLTACISNCMAFLNPNNECQTECASGLSTETVQKYQKAVDCVANDCANDCNSPDWTCLGAVVDPGARLPAQSIQLHLWLQDYSQPTLRFADVTALACTPGSWSCSDFVAMAGPSDQTGIIDLQLEAGSLGFPKFVELSGPNVGIQILGIVSPPLVRDTWRTALLFTQAEGDALAASFGAPDPSSADIGVLMTSCVRRPGPGVQLEVVGQPQAQVHYLDDPSADRTSVNNFVYITGVAPGGAQLRAFMADHPEQVISSLQVPTKANEGTFLVLGPTPL